MTGIAEIRAAIDRERARYPLKAIRQQYGETLIAIAEANPRLLVLTADLMHATGMAEFGRRFPDRLINLGIAEQNVTGVAAGLALAGRPGVVDGYAAFTTLRAVEQAKVDVAYNALKLILTGQSAGLTYGVGGPSHQTYEDVAIMRAIPNTVVLVPSDAVETDACQRAAMLHEASTPIYIRLGRGPEHVFNPAATPFVIGRAATLREGRDIAFIANGPMAFEAMLAADCLAAQGVSARVINMHTVKPLDRDVLIRAAGEVNAMIVIVEHSVAGGLGGAVAEALSEVRHGPIRLLGIGNDVFPPIGPVSELRASLGLDAANIVANAQQMLSARTLEVAK
jgi:transketolase